MPSQPTPWNSLHSLHRIIARMLEKDFDLSARQMAILLTVYLAPPPHTVTLLSQRIGISKAAVSRALDTLCDLDFIHRQKQPQDNRIALLQRTLQGSAFLADLGEAHTTEPSWPSLVKISA